MPYLAMTAAEFRTCGQLPPKPGWMACHFSPYSTGLTNLPRELPAGSMLILNDRTPIHGHDPERIFAQLRNCVEALKCEAVLLDLQRDSKEAPAIIDKLLTLPCPVAVSQLYAGTLDCPIFLPPVPMMKTAEEYLTPWRGRPIWLEVALEGLQITVTKNGSTASALPAGTDLACPLQDEELQLHYRIDVSADHAVFTLQRTREDLQKLLHTAKDLGVTQSVGLWQELGG